MKILETLDRWIKQLMTPKQTYSEISERLRKEEEEWARKQAGRLRAEGWLFLDWKRRNRPKRKSPTPKGRIKSSKKANTSQP